MFEYCTSAPTTLLARVRRCCATMLVATVFLTGGVVATVATVHAQTAERVAFRSRSIAVYNLVGRLRVTGDAASAVATVTRRGQDAGRLTVSNSVVDGREALRIKYPGDRITVPGSRGGRSRTDIRVRDDGSFGSRYDARNTRGATRYTDGRRVRIGDEGGIEAAADIELQVPNGVSVRLHLAVGNVDVRNVTGDIAIDVSGGDVVVNDTQGTLTIDTGSGDATVTNATGIITLDTGSGTVRARGIGGSELTIDSGSGEVTVNGCTSSNVRIDTGSGDLRVSDMTPRSLALDTGSGEVVLGLRNSPDVTTIDNGSGNVTLTLPADFSATLDIDSGSGRITSDFAIQVASTSRDEMHGRIGRGAGRLSIETGSGNVRLQKAN